MSNEIVFLIIGLLVGAAALWAITKEKLKSNSQSNEEIKLLREKHTSTNALLVSKTTEYENLKNQFVEIKSELDTTRATIKQLETELATKTANINTSTDVIKSNSDDIQRLKNELQIKTKEFNDANTEVAGLSANNTFLREKLDTQKVEIEDMRKHFNSEFQIIANKILDEKTEKFTTLNKTNLKDILDPLGENLKSFKEKVEDVYVKEREQRFSLGEEVKKLVLANQKISEEANNLTNALTSKGKTQGDWGQMILESILEKSGLGKGTNYFVQEYLKDDLGNNLVNEQGQKMQPDVIIAYPDNRKVIVDSKVSLTAYNRYISSTIKEEETKALNEHLKSIRNHIDDLSAKSYQDFAPSLDFVMMFVPIEPAYLMAIHTDQDLWSYAYNKRILLTSPSNLIVALKMIVDLWKRDNQSKNHQAIVERGGKLYDKFAMVLDSLKDIGSNLKATQKSYNTAVSQLSEGNDNVLRQVGKLKDLGAKAKKSLPEPGSLPLLEYTTDNDDTSNEN